MADEITREAIQSLGFLRRSPHYFEKRGTTVNVSFPMGTNEIVVRARGKKTNIKTISQLRATLAEIASEKISKAERDRQTTGGTGGKE